MKNIVRYSVVVSPNAQSYTFQDLYPLSDMGGSYFAENLDDGARQAIIQYSANGSVWTDGITITLAAYGILKGEIACAYGAYKYIRIIYDDAGTPVADGGKGMRITITQFDKNLTRNAIG